MAPQGYEFQSEFARKHAEEGRKAGLEEGRRIGFEEGLEEVRREGEQKMLLKQLGLKFGALPEPVVQRIRSATELDIERWVERLLTAWTLDDVFTD
jgi:flagellar biosynthesis/type III secretory pathway protein FliH